MDKVSIPVPEHANGLDVVLKKRSGAYDIHTYLRTLIVDGKLPPDRVVSQAGLARDLGVSRTPVREAMRMLQNEGLLDARPNNRARVRALAVEELEAIYVTRILLESAGIALSVPKMTEVEFEGLDRSLARMTTDECRLDFNLWLREHRDFHSRLVGLCGEGLLRRIMQANEQSTRFQYLYTTQEPHWWVNRTAAHVELVSACKARKVAWATRLLAQHLAQTALTLLANLPDNKKGTGAVQLVLEMVTAGSTTLPTQ
ncbi:MAG: hypothetical protein A3H35_18770 [Betaproteobacteria bacterium RIFCSPLOWO2_02_FULL_62_17]|nr:MAG: hypothetical protein A3H35_18770 [Betaproteobacteria bacterium RIFCSPLOWO2_02_FULL_62_17]